MLWTMPLPDPAPQPQVLDRAARRELAAVDRVGGRPGAAPVQPLAPDLGRGDPGRIHPDGLHDFIQSPGWGSLGLLGLVLLSEGTAEGFSWGSFWLQVLISGSEACR
jgi:hypothetical protein